MKVIDLAKAVSEFKLARAIQAAAVWGVFDSLHDAATSIQDLAIRVGKDPSRIQALAAVLVPAGVLVFADGVLKVHPAHRASTVPGGVGSMLNYFKWMSFQYSQFNLLLDESERKADWLDWMGCLDELAHRDGYARKVAQCLPLMEAHTLLDIGGGSGAYTRAICDYFPDLLGIIFEKSPVADITRDYVASWPVRDRIRVMEGDCSVDPFPDMVDAVLVSNVLHGKTEAFIESLCDKVMQALVPGGTFIIHGHHVHDEFEHSIDAGLLQLTMNINGNGRVYSIDFLRQFVLRRGFELIRVASPRGEQTPDLLITRKPFSQ